MDYSERTGFLPYAGCHNQIMETPLSPLEFARRTRRLHGDREAVVDGDLRLSYQQFFDRCDRWSAALQGLGVAQGDRVATIAPNTHAQLESFYAVPQLGAVLVPINYRLTPEDFVYIVNHSGATVVCAAREYLAVVDSVRDRMPEVRHFVAFEGSTSEGGASEGGASEGGADGWLDYEAAIAATDPGFARPEIGERDLLSINYTSGTTARPKGVMITHRNAAMNTIGTLLHLPMGVGQRYLWTLPMFHANGWTYTWTVTAAAGTHICLRKVDPATIFGLIRDEKVSWLCAAPTVLISLANAPAAVRGEVPPGVHVVTAGAPPAAATIERLEGEFGWEITQVYGLTETAPFITVCAPLPEHEDLPSADRAVIKARQGVELLTSGELRVVDNDGREVPADGQTVGEIVVRGNVVMVPRSRWRAPCSVTPPCRKSRSSACRTRSGARRRTPSWCSATAPAPRKRSSSRSCGSAWPTSRPREASPSSTSYRRPRPARSRSSCCGRGRLTSLISSIHVLCLQFRGL